MYVLGWLHSYAEVLLSHEQRPSALELQAYRAHAYPSRLDALSPPIPPGEFVGRAGCDDGSVLRIGSGDRVVPVDLKRGIPALGVSQPRSIGVYVRRGGYRGFDEIVLPHFRQLTLSEWLEQQRQGDRFLEESLERLGQTAPTNTAADHQDAQDDPDAPDR